MIPTVLVIDDSATVRLQVARALTFAGFAIVEAGDGLEGLEKLEAGNITVIVCDVNMPRMSGIELVEKLATREGTPPILMLTTEGHPELIRRAKSSGARGWMVKPFKPELLVSAVRRISESRPR